MPSLSSSPGILGAPQNGFSRLILRIRSRSSLAIRGRPPGERDFHRQKAAKPIRCQRTTVSGPDDGYGVKNARAATIEPNEQSTIGPTQVRSAWRSLLQHIELMPQYHDLGFQLLLRFEAVAQHADEQEADGNHAAIMF
jgi:hypothetical protein